MAFFTFLNNNRAEEAYPLNPLDPLPPADGEPSQGQADPSVLFNAWSQATSSDVQMSAEDDTGQAAADDAEDVMELEPEPSAMPGTLFPDNDSSSSSMIVFNPWSSSSVRKRNESDEGSETSVVKKSGKGAKVMLVEVDESNTLRRNMYSLKANFQRSTIDLEGNFLQKQKMYRATISQIETQRQQQIARITQLENEKEKMVDDTQKVNSILADRESKIAQQEVEIQLLQKKFEEHRFRHNTESELELIVQRLKADQESEITAFAQKYDVALQKIHRLENDLSKKPLENSQGTMVRCSPIPSDHGTRFLHTNTPSSGSRLIGAFESTTPRTPRPLYTSNLTRQPPPPTVLINVHTDSDDEPPRPPVSSQQASSGTRSAGSYLAPPAPIVVDTDSDKEPLHLLISSQRTSSSMLAGTHKNIGLPKPSTKRQTSLGVRLAGVYESNDLPRPSTRFDNPSPLDDSSIKKVAEEVCRLLGQNPPKCFTPPKRQMKAVFKLKQEIVCDKEQNENLDHVRELFKVAFGVTSDDDFFLIHGASREQVQAFESGSSGPDPENLQWDYSQPATSVWNKAVVSHLLQQLKVLRHEEDWSTQPRSDEYWADAISQKFSCIKTRLSHAKPRVRDDSIETEEEVAARLIKDKECRLQKGQKDERRLNKYRRRFGITKKLVEVKMEGDEGDAAIWQFLHNVVKMLGSNGMSSDESGDESMETVFYTHAMPWRRDIRKELNIIDIQRLQEKDIFSPRGAKITKRARGGNLSSRPSPTGLPQSFYDAQWLKDNPDAPSDETFPWMGIMTR